MGNRQARFGGRSLRVNHRDYLQPTGDRRGVVCSVSGVSPTPTWSRVLSGKVHGAQGVLVDLHGLGQGLLVAPVALARRVTALSTERSKAVQL